MEYTSPAEQLFTGRSRSVEDNPTANAPSCCAGITPRALASSHPALDLGIRLKSADWRCYKKNSPNSQNLPYHRKCAAGIFPQQPLEIPRIPASAPQHD